MENQTYLAHAEISLVDKPKVIPKNSEKQEPQLFYKNPSSMSSFAVKYVTFCQ
jgi:hypothetical protein